MTEISEVRWQCDYIGCRHVSPVLERGMIHNPVTDRDDYGHVPPKNWSYIIVNMPYGEKGQWTRPVWKHFCRPEHEAKWLKTQQREEKK